ncbi:hypothetical protein CC85DRAFT_148602 [Cutaneotrichosporon oleaginosum]|uniref:Uncharacterized protein n=1 Tax=Cutaneotrichosporon oleaginosum TaxID=879819 RepID=A0A0J0XHH4_9TREE|nr:uncharacterized protein CC85DRAFT_148602 [Cutaneotrichosporon oleaginosum]KLT40551.1 hypothetical protein CC85DRAFT_148602 [Cutaneotrichosporon oleaginosum]TXT08378.1 hypothetical protein COLE_05302 [Cutaneotrichosporon oleaginosum]
MFSVGGRSDGELAGWPVSGQKVSVSPCVTWWGGVEKIRAHARGAWEARGNHVRFACPHKAEKPRDCHAPSTRQRQASAQLGQGLPPPGGRRGAESPPPPPTAPVVIPPGHPAIAFRPGPALASSST